MNFSLAGTLQGTGLTSWRQMHDIDKKKRYNCKHGWFGATWIQHSLKVILLRTENKNTTLTTQYKKKKTDFITHHVCIQMQQNEVVILKLTLQCAPKPCHSFSTSPKLEVQKSRLAAYVRPSTYNFPLPPPHSRKTPKTNVFSAEVTSAITANRWLFCHSLWWTSFIS